jgi:hypothetical protein
LKNKNRNDMLRPCCVHSSGLAKRESPKLKGFSKYTTQHRFREKNEADTGVSS